MCENNGCLQSTSYVSLLKALVTTGYELSAGKNGQTSTEYTDGHTKHQTRLDCFQHFFSTSMLQNDFYARIDKVFLKSFKPDF